MRPNLRIVEDYTTIKIYVGAELILDFQKNLLSSDSSMDVNSLSALVNAFSDNRELLMLLMMQLREDGKFEYEKR